MTAAQLFPILLGIAWLIPLASFVAILFFGNRMGDHGKGAATVATSAIGISFFLSLITFFAWVMAGHEVSSPHHDDAHASVHRTYNDTEQSVQAVVFRSPEHGDAGGSHASGHGEAVVPASYSGDWYTLYESGTLRLSIGWYIDSITVLMFVVVTFIATCIHFYAAGYMHDELHDVTDSEVRLATGEPLHREGRFPRFFQALSLFCFSMLGIVIAGNLAMVFIFWELVGICSWFLIGFYFERHSASTAANKAFIVNRVGDFGMLIGLMAALGGLGTLQFGDSVSSATGQVEPGLFELVRPAENHHEQQVPDGLVAFAAADQIEKMVAANPSSGELSREVAAAVPDWREQGYGRWLLFIAGLGIFCGCVAKAHRFHFLFGYPMQWKDQHQFQPVHSATMVAAGVYLVGRFSQCSPQMSCW